VNKRATVWLLATLIAFCGAGAAPVLRARQLNESSSIVWIARARAERRIAVENRSAKRSYPAARAIRQIPEDPCAGGREFANSLYQRPPPFSSC